MHRIDSGDDIAELAPLQISDDLDSEWPEADVKDAQAHHQRA
jgi:hypothetical protein